MHCTIYKSLKKADLYLFLPKETLPEALGAAILEPFGRLEMVMTLDLSENRPLARTDAATVRHYIQTLGFYVQLPPSSQNWAHWDNLKAGIGSV
ncbi:MAG TPA: YcgL domain-containing protein [Halothiobacillus sp.]|nr:YcgL domain-containing protein [Halothiobacillus sp.]